MWKAQKYITGMGKTNKNNTLFSLELKQLLIMIFWVLIFRILLMNFGAEKKQNNWVKNSRDAKRQLFESFISLIWRFFRKVKKLIHSAINFVKPSSYESKNQQYGM